MLGIGSVAMSIDLQTSFELPRQVKKKNKRTSKKLVKYCKVVVMIIIIIKII